MARHLLIAAVAAFALVLPACGDDDDDEGAQQPAETTAQAAAPDGTYVGEVSGTDAYIALVIDEGKLSGYVCDSKQVSTWLTSPRADGESVALESRQGDSLGEVGFAGDTADGSVEIAGEEQTFTLERATGEAGLYRAAKGRPGEEGFVEVGWVLLADGTQRGGTNFIDPQSDIAVSPAPNLNPGAANVTVNTGAGNAVKLAQQRVQRFIDPITGL